MSGPKVPESVVTYRIFDLETRELRRSWRWKMRLTAVRSALWRWPIRVTVRITFFPRTQRRLASIESELSRIRLELQRESKSA